MSQDFNDDLVRRMAALLDETGLGELEYETKDLKIRIARAQVQIAAAAPMAAGPAATPTAAATIAVPAAATGETVASPMVGTVYTAAEPGAVQAIWSMFDEKGNFR